MKLPEWDEIIEAILKLLEEDTQDDDEFLEQNTSA